MTTPSNKMAPMIGNKDRPGDSTQITMPTKGEGGALADADLDARILQVVEGALAAGPGTAPVIDNTARDELEAKIGAVETKNTEQDTRIAALEGAAAPAIPDVDWTLCKNLEGTGKVEARVLNGIVLLRGTLTYTHESASTYVIIGELPAGVPAPAADSNFTVWANETGVAQRIAAVRVSKLGRIAVSAPTGPFTSIAFSSVTYPAY